MRPTTAPGLVPMLRKFILLLTAWGLIVAPLKVAAQFDIFGGSDQSQRSRTGTTDPTTGTTGRTPIPPIGGEPRPPGGGGGGGGGSSWIGPAVVTGVAAIGLIGALLKNESEASDRDPGNGPDDLLRQGPQVPPKFNMSAFAIRGLVRGGWPIVVRYESRTRGKIKLEVSAKGHGIKTFDLSSYGSGKHIRKFTLPSEWGNSLKPGLVAVTATSSAGRSTIADFRVYGVGVGPKAVGSVAVDQLSFDPTSIRTRRGQTAGYRFYSRSDFDRVAVEFLRVSNRGDGKGNQEVDSDILPKGVRKNQWIDDPARYAWDGLDKNGLHSGGAHTLQVRAWAGTGDWVGAWSESILTVRE